MGWWMIFGGLMFGFFIAGMATLAAIILRPTPGNNVSRQEPDEAIAIVRRRYAKGEIDSAEFNKLMKDLE